MRRSAAITTVVLVSLLTAACSPAGSADSTTTSPTSSTTTSSLAPAESPDLLIAMEVHVEGWTYPSETVLDQHLGELGELMDAAEAHGAVLSLELGHAFVAAMATAGRTTWADEVRARGHDVQLHADVGGSGVPSEATLTLQMLDQVTDAATIDVVPSVVTGVCSKGRWVEAAANAGFTAVAGMVEYCLHAQDPANDPPAFDRAACTSPVSCHVALGTLLDVDVPWHAAQSTDFLSDVDASTPGAVLLIPGTQGPICGSEADSESSCVWDSADPEAFAAELSDAISGRDPVEQSVFTTAWSVGQPVDPAVADDLFARLEIEVAEGHAHWVRISDIT